MWDHLYPCRTQKLSTYTPKVLVWRRTGRIGSCWLDVPLLRGIYYSSIAQSVEHLTVNQGVAGSSPARGAIENREAAAIGGFFLLPKRMMK